MEVELGKIVGIWGVKGWLKLHSYTRNRADIAQYKKWWLKPPGKVSGENARKNLQSPTPGFIPVKVLQCREQGKGIVAQLEGLDDPDIAISYNGYSIWVEKADLPKLPAGQYYWQQLIGLAVWTKDSELIGTIDSILETGANDVLIISTPNKTETLVPYTDQVVEEVDIELGRMTVDWDPTYLLD